MLFTSNKLERKVYGSKCIIKREYQLQITPTENYSPPPTANMHPFTLHATHSDINTCTSSMHTSIHSNSPHPFTQTAHAVGVSGRMTQFSFLLVHFICSDKVLRQHAIPSPSIDKIYRLYLYTVLVHRTSQSPSG